MWHDSRLVVACQPFRIVSGHRQTNTKRFISRACRSSYPEDELACVRVDLDDMDFAWTPLALAKRHLGSLVRSSFADNPGQRLP